jgi:hypothetical protein
MAKGPPRGPILPALDMLICRRLIRCPIHLWHIGCLLGPMEIPTSTALEDPSVEAKLMELEVLGE